MMKGVNKDLFKPVATKRAFEDISDQIKYLIYSKALKPNDRLPSERELAARFNTGRISVREALRILEESGFVSIKHGAEGGIFVKELDSTSMTKSISGLIEVGNLTLLEITEARISIESIILESIFKTITKENLAAIESNITACEQLRNSVDGNSKESWIERLRMFHVLIAGLSRNRLYKYLVTSLIDLYKSYAKRIEPQIEEYHQHLDQHRAIFEAIKSKDLKRAQNALRDHLYSLTKSIRKDIMKFTKAFDRRTL
jgi:GntR family transcriptional repressor for pyruvate dehydrogenase complex